MMQTEFFMEAVVLMDPMVTVFWDVDPLLDHISVDGERRGECSDDGNTDNVSHAQGSFGGLILLVSSGKISLPDYSSQNLDAGVIEITD
jgi:hypothetical protein